jgi:hypothetical protein
VVWSAGTLQYEERCGGVILLSLWPWRKMLTARANSAKTWRKTPVRAGSHL